MAFPEVGLACEMLLPMHDYSQIMNHFMQSYPLRRTHFGQCRSSSNLRLEKKNDHACSLVHYLPCSSRLWVHFDSSTTDSSANCNVQSRSSHTLAFLQGSYEEVCARNDHLTKFALCYSDNCAARINTLYGWGLPCLLQL